MATTVLQELRHASVSAVTGTHTNYEGDWSALFDLYTIPKYDWNGRLLLYINYALQKTYTNLPEAMVAFAIAKGAAGVRRWDEMGTFTAAVTLFEEEMPGINWDWPNPIQPRYSILLKTFTQETTRINNLLKGQEIFFTKNRNWEFDWTPTPPAKTPPVLNKTFIQETDRIVNLLKSQDKFFSGAGKGPNSDWTNPILRKPFFYGVTATASRINDDGVTLIQAQGWM